MIGIHYYVWFMLHREKKRDREREIKRTRRKKNDRLICEEKGTQKTFWELVLFRRSS